MTRRIILMLLLAISVGCASDADLYGNPSGIVTKSNGGLLESAGKYLGVIGPVAGVVGAGFTVAAHLGLTPGAYAQLSDQTIDRIADRVGQNVQRQFMSRDTASFHALMATETQNVRYTCIEGGDCSSELLRNMHNWALAVNTQANGLWAQMTNTDLGYNRVQLAQHVARIGASRLMALHQIELVEAAQGASAVDLENRRQTLRETATEVLDELDELEQVHRDYLFDGGDNLFGAVRFYQGGRRNRRRARACFDSPTGRWCTPYSNCRTISNCRRNQSRIEGIAVAEKDRQVAAKALEQHSTVFGGARYSQIRAQLRTIAGE